jgi:hypothetical protein
LEQSSPPGAEEGRVAVKLFPVHDDYLRAASGVSWLNVVTRVDFDLAESGEEDYGDTDNLQWGKGYWIDPKWGSPNWMWSQCFMRFDMTNMVRFADDRLTTVKLRMRIWDDQSTPQIYQMGILATPFTIPLDGSQWVDSTSEFTAWQQSRFRADMYSDDVGGYWELEFDESMKAAIPRTGTFDINLMVKASHPPPNMRWLMGYSGDYGTVSLRPYLKVVIDDMREQIIEALVTRLNEIDETAGYNLTVKSVIRRPTPIDQLDEPEFPLIVVYGAEEDRERQASYTDEALWRVRVALCVFADPDDQTTELNRFIADIERAVDEDNQTGLPPLELDGLLECWVKRVEWSIEGVLDSNRAMAFVDIACAYHHITLTT